MREMESSAPDESGWIVAMNRVEQAVSCFKGGFNCSQAILSTFAHSFGLNREVALKLAAGFGGGMGRMAGTCGAVTGAFMVLGLQYGPVEAGDQQARETTYERVREFTRRFEARNGSVICRELIQCDIDTPEGLAAARQNRLFATVCPKFVQDAAEILDEILK
jgi:C_GCAxxG_C_C family probable redox protein